MLGHAVLQSLGQESDDLLRDRCQRLDPPPAVREVAVRRQRLELGADPGQDARAVGVDRWLVEPSEPDAAGEVTDHREPELGRAPQSLEQLPSVRRQVARRSRLVDPATEHRRGQRHLGRLPLLGQEDPEHRLLERRGALQVGHPVVLQHREQPVVEVLGETAALDVETLQEGVEVLAGAVHPQLGLAFLVGGAIAAELREVRERAEQRHLLGNDGHRARVSSSRTSR